METARISAVPVHQTTYRGRVRSGCLTCRSRKVKCDETRPICKNCTRLKRHCVYKPRNIRLLTNSPTVKPPQTQSSEGGNSQSPPLHAVSQVHSGPQPEQESSGTEEPSGNDATGRTESNGHQLFLFPDSSTVDVTARLEKALMRNRHAMPASSNAERSADSPFALISRDIELTTTMDLLVSCDEASQPALSFFMDTVDCPAITPFDGLNWQRMKHSAVEMGKSSPAVNAAIVAVSMLYKGQLYSLPHYRALSLYLSARNAHRELLNDQTQDFNIVILATFLLCLFELVHSGEETPVLKEPSDLFLTNLKSWALQRQSQSELSRRLIRWLKILRSVTMRGGGTGLISDSVHNLFPSYDDTTPNLRSPSGHDLDVSIHIYEAISTPIFDLYFGIQMLSGEIAHLTHYHRSRTTSVDQKEVVRQITQIKSRLHAIWEDRPAPLRQTPEGLRSHLAHKVVDPLLTLSGLCTAAYLVELVEIDRVLGDPVTKWTDSRQALWSLREIIDGDWNAYGPDGKLNPGYLRPLFLYAIECMDEEQNQWAVERLRQIQSPIYRSEFFGSFGKALSDAQIQKERRVTSKYFCIWYFGVPPPFM